MKTVKTVNYSPEMTAELKAAYMANPTKETVATFAVKFGKAEKSVIAKLSREGVYRKAEYKTKKGELPIKKESMAHEIALKLGMTDEQAESLTKANKTVLRKIAESLGVVISAAVEAEDMPDSDEAEKAFSA